MIEISTRVRPLALRALACAASLTLLCGDGGWGCTTPYPDQSWAQLSVTVTQPSGTYRPGETVSFRVAITNTGDRAFTDGTMVARLDYNVQSVSYACTGQAPSNKPTPAFCGQTSDIFVLEPGATMTVDAVVKVVSAQSHVVTNSIVVHVPSGPDVVAQNTVMLANPPGTGYQAFFSDGRTLAASVDAAHATLTFAGDGGATLPYTITAGSDTRRLPGGAGWREASDLLVGTAALGGGARPFIAAQWFANTVAELDGRAFTLFETGLRADGSTFSRVSSAAVSGSTMQLCLDAIPHAIASCPAASLHQYQLTAGNGDFFAADTEGNLVFQAMQSGDALVLVHSEKGASGWKFLLGVPANSATGALTLEGGDNRGRWGSLALAPSTSTLQEALALGDAAPVTIDGTLLVPAGSPTGLFVGSLGDPDSTAWLAQGGPLALVMGQPGTPVDGLLQLFAR